MNSLDNPPKRRQLSLLNPVKRKNQTSKQRQYSFGTKELCLTQEMVFSNKIQDPTDSNSQNNISPVNTDVFNQLLNYDKKQRQVQTKLIEKVDKLKRNKSCETLTSGQLHQMFDYPTLDLNLITLETSTTQAISVDDSILVDKQPMPSMISHPDQKKAAIQEITNDIQKIIVEQEIVISDDIIPDLKIDDVQWPRDDFSDLLRGIQYDKVISDKCIDYLVVKLKEQSYEKLCDRYMWRIQQQRVKNYIEQTEIYHQQQYEALNRYCDNYPIINVLDEQIGYLNLSRITFYKDFCVYVGEIPVQNQISTFYRYVEKLGIQNVINFGNIEEDLKFYPQSQQENNYIYIMDGLVLNKRKSDIIDNKLVKYELQLRLEQNIIDIDLLQYTDYYINTVIKYESMYELCKTLYDHNFNINGSVFLSSKGLNRPTTFLICYFLFVSTQQSRQIEYRDILILIEKVNTQRSCKCFISAELTEYVFKFYQYVKQRCQ